MRRAVRRRKHHTSGAAAQCGGGAQCGDSVVALRARPLSEGVMRHIMSRHETRRQAQVTPYVVW